MKTFARKECRLLHCHFTIIFIICNSKMSHLWALAPSLTDESSCSSISIGEICFVKLNFSWTFGPCFKNESIFGETWQTGSWTTDLVFQNLESPNEVRCFLLNKKFPDMVMSPKVTILPSLILYEVSHWISHRRKTILIFYITISGNFLFKRKQRTSFSDSRFWIPDP